MRLDSASMPTRLPMPLVLPVPSTARARMGSLLAWSSRALLLVLLGLLPTRGALAASLEAVLDREVIALGDSAVLQVTLQGTSETPRIPAIPGVDIRQVSSQRQFAFVNGVQSSTLVLGYGITPSRLGEFTLGPVTVSIRGQTLSSAPLKLRVVAPNDPAAARGDGLDEAAFLELHLPATEVYVGERFVAEAHLYALGGNLRQSPQFQADGFTLGPLSNSQTETNVRTNNRIYARVRFIQPLTAARTGDLPLQASGGLIEIPINRRGPGNDIFEEFFGGREVRRFSLATPPTTLHVLPLPRQGQPPGFNGAVGDFQVGMTATPVRVAAGDPIKVSIQIRGRGNFDSVQLPEQPAWKGFRVYPPTSTNAPNDVTGLTGTKTFEQVLIPESADLTELPGLQFSFFNPATRKYQTERTPAIPLQVSAGATTPSLPVTAGQGNADPKASEPKLLPLKPHLGPVVAETTAAPWIHQPWFVALYLLPGLGWFGTRLWNRARQRRDADATARQREQLLGRVASGLRKLDASISRSDSEAFHADLFRVLQDSLAARTGLPSASITEGTLDTALPSGSLPPETLQALHALFQACNQARYARQATPGDLQELRDAAANVTRKLAERPLPSRPG